MMYRDVDQIKYFVPETQALLSVSCASRPSDVCEARCGHPRYTVWVAEKASLSELQESSMMLVTSRNVVHNYINNHPYILLS
jgi:hypothetical protein